MGVRTNEGRVWRCFLDWNGPAFFWSAAPKAIKRDCTISRNFVCICESDLVQDCSSSYLAI